MKKVFIMLLSLCFCAAVPLNALAAGTEALPDSPAWIAALGEEKGAKQLFVVAGMRRMRAAPGRSS